MKIAFLMRFDFIKKRGGDVVQVEAYCRELDALGHQCQLLDKLTPVECDKYDIFVLVNIDRPVETIDYWRTLKTKAAKKPVFLIPIHHPISAINQFERNRRGLGYKCFNILFPDFYSREKVKNFIRFRKCSRLFFKSLEHLVISYRRTLSDILRCSDGIIYISDGERLSVERDFGVKSARYVVAHNAVHLEQRPTYMHPASRKYDVIVVGRIEPRKNQLSVINAFKETSYKVCFVGAINENSDKYCDEFLSQVSKYRQMEYLGSRPHSETLQWVANSRLLLNASYFEVNPLVDLEAALVGTEVVTTRCSYSNESLPNSPLVDPWSIEDILCKVEGVLTSHWRTLEGARIAESWQEPVLIIEKMLLEANVRKNA